MRTSTLAILGTCAVLAVANANTADAQSKCTAAKIKAAGKKAACKLGVEAGAAAKNLPADTAKLAKCTAAFSAAFTKAEASTSPCIAPNGDAGAIESKVDMFVNDVDTTEVGSNTLPSKCISAKLKAAGKKASCKLGIYSKAAAKALPPDTGKLGGCSSKFSAASTKADGGTDCGTASGDAGTIEGKVDAFVTDVNGELASATTTSTTTTSTTTTTTMLLRFTTALGTTSCGAAGLSPGASAPVAGELDSDTGCSTHLVDLGRSCLYFGGGKATVVPPGPVPDGSEYRFTVPAAGTIAGNAGTGPSNCTLGDGPGKHCINGFCNTDADCGNVAGACQTNRCNPGTQTTPLSCTTDASCGGCSGCCGLDANCYFGPPLPIASPPPNDALTTCVLNVIQTTAYGTFDASTGAATIGMPLGSRVYITGNSASPCPKCLAGTCDASWNDVNSAPGEDNGKSCVFSGSVGTTLDCRPPLSGFQAELPIDYGTTPLTTGASSKTATDGRMCASINQTVSNAGAFGQPTAKCIKESGAAAGDLTDNLPHAAVISTVFCVPKTGNVAVDGVAALPGPGAVAINGAMTLQ